VAGVFLANLLRPDDHLHVALHGAEKPFYVILLIIAGMWWSVGSPSVWGLAVALVAARLWLKKVSLDTASSMLLPGDRPPRGVGLALGAQGALALAIGLNYILVYPGVAPKLAFGVIAINVMINEAAAPYLIGRALGGSK